jgi:AcrR family transcriptional regulator
MPRAPKTTVKKVPRQERSRATVEALLEATARVLVKDGYERASTNRIAEVAGVNIASLYQYFPSKESLVAALIDRHLEEISSKVAANMIVAGVAPLPEAVRAIVRSHIALHQTRPRLHKVLLEQIPRVERLNPIIAFRRQIIELVHTWLQHRRKELRPRDLEFAAFATVHVIDALTQAALLERPDYLDDGRLVDEISAVVVGYLT